MPPDVSLASLKKKKKKPEVVTESEITSNFGDVVSETDTPNPRIDVKQVLTSSLTLRRVSFKKRGVSLSPHSLSLLSVDTKRKQTPAFPSVLPPARISLCRELGPCFDLRVTRSRWKTRSSVRKPRRAGSEWGTCCIAGAFLSRFTGGQAPVTGTGHRLITCTHRRCWPSGQSALYPAAAAAAGGGFVNVFSPS